MVYKSVASNNSYTGFYCAGGGALFSLVLQDVTANGNQYGIKGDGAAVIPLISIFNSVSMGNTISDAYNFNGAYIASYGNNGLGVTSGLAKGTLN